MPEPLTTDFSALAAECGLPLLAVQLLAQRGLTDAAAIRKFLSPSLDDLHDFRQLPDIGAAGARIAQAVRRKERVMVFGDYDVDGTTAIALLVRVLRSLGAEPECYTPHRAFEGYGLSAKGVQYARDSGHTLIITADCGTTDFEEIELARKLGIDVVVSDHHETKATLPQARAVVNPHRHDSKYPFAELCGCGVAMKLAQAVCQELGKPPEMVYEHLDLVALATIADIVPLTGENRVLAKLGLERLEKTHKVGLRALLKKTGLENKKLGGNEVGFILGPRINASGRVADAEHAVRLMLTEDGDEADELADTLSAANNERRKIEVATLRQALQKVQAKGVVPNVIVLADEGWHEGVIGIVASRIADRFYRPTIMISLTDGHGKGSGRSIPGFHLYDALSACAEDLLGFGGHKYAAGLTIDAPKVADFDQRINDYAGRCLTPELLQRKYEVSAQPPLSALDQQLLDVLSKFEPFGIDNPRPLFAALGLEVVGYPRQVGNEHLGFTVRENRKDVRPAIAFGRSAELSRLETGRQGHLDILYHFAERTYNGRTSIQLQVKDLRINSQDEKSAAVTDAQVATR